MTRALAATLVTLVLLLAPGCATSYTIGALTHPWSEIGPPVNAWIVLDDSGTPERVVVVAEAREHVNPNVFLGPGIVLPPGRTGLARVIYEAPAGEAGELAVLDHEVPERFVATRYSGLGASPEERKRFHDEAPLRGVPVTFLEPGVFERGGRRYRLAREVPRTFGARLGWASLLPLALAFDLVLLPVYLGFTAVLLAS